MSTDSASAWHLDKASKVPLYVQLRDLIKYSISTGAIRRGERLPGVVELGRALQVNFETVRKAYKEVEKEGMISVGRGRGTHAGPAAPSSRAGAPPSDDRDVSAQARQVVAQFLARGLSVEATRAVLDRALLEATTGRYLLFTECNSYEVETIAPLLSQHLGVPVHGVLVSDLRGELDRSQAKRPLAVVTTGFHLSEVRRSLTSMDVEVEAVVTHMSLETRRALDRFPRDGRFGFVCRDADSIPLYHDMLKAELRLTRELPCVTLADSDQVVRMLGDVDVVLTSPPVFPQVRDLAGSRVPVFNVLDHVDPVSILAIRERLFRDWNGARR